MSDTHADQEKRGSGQPGGGQGRIDETGLPGVYPGDGPWPEEDVPNTAAAGDRATPAPIEAAIEVPYHEWESFFNDLSRRHEGDVVRVEIGTADPGWPIDSITRRLADGLPLAGIVAEFRDEAPGTIEIILGTEPSAQITHTITQPTHVWFAQGEQGDDRAVQIESADNPSALIRF